MSQTVQERNKALVLEAFDTLFSRWREIGMVSKSQRYGVELF
jgi:hypothetical protein